MNPSPLIIEPTDGIPPGRRRCEAAERKGLGHPDSICDAVMERISLALCREYLNVFGRVLHHNVDKGLLVAGRTSPRLGGGEVLEPMRLVLGDRATYEYEGKRVDVAGIAEAEARIWFTIHLPHLDPERHLIFQNELKPGSPELVDIFAKQAWCANDTSAAVGYAPLTETESLVLEAEKYLNGQEFKRLFPEAGEDVKVMGYRQDQRLDLTVAVAFVDRFVPSGRAYFARKEEMRRTLLDFLRGRLRRLQEVSVSLNTLDDPNRGEAGMYLTVLGTSAEGGDCGAVGRGNPVNGVISLHRPRGAEAAAGKNPVSHVGKIYSLFAHHLADRMHRDIPGLEEVTVSLGSQIGRTISDPAMASIQLSIAKDARREDVEPAIREIYEREIRGLDAFVQKLVSGIFPIC